MKRVIRFTALLTTATIFIIACNQATVQTTASAPGNDSLVRRGHYLVTVMGCGDCHTPKKFGAHGPEDDSSLLLSGHPSSVPLPAIDTAARRNWVLFNYMQTAVVGPWGVSFSANLTSDSTGIGNWTEAQFETALRHGKSKGLENNRMLLPPMPWSSYGRMNDADLKSIFAYLKSTRPVKNVVPAPLR